MHVRFLLYTYTEAGLCCSNQIPALHPKGWGYFRLSLFMAAKFGTLIHLGDVAELVLKAQMGSKFKKALIICHINILMHHSKYVCVQGCKREKQNLLQFF